MAVTGGVAGVLGSVNWTNVLVALIAGLPAIIAAVYAGRIHSKVKTPSGTSIGRQVEDVLHTALGNNYHLQSIGKAVKADTTADGEAEASKVPGPNGGRGEQTPPV